MFGELIIAYLFCAGTGAGGAAAASLADILFVHEPFGAWSRTYEDKTPSERLVALSFGASVGAVGFGGLCLLFDVGRADRVVTLFLSPQPSLMVVGAWALLLLFVVLAACTLVRFLYLPWVSRSLVVSLEIIACILAMIVAVYAGLLLFMNLGVRLWATPWVTVLFVLSAISCGCALMMTTPLFVQGDDASWALIYRVMAADSVVLMLELGAAALFLVYVVGVGHPGVQASADSLLRGKAAFPFWVGFIACGIVLPLVAEAICFFVRRKGSLFSSWGGHFVEVGSACFANKTIVWPLALVALLVLCGGVGLRASVVMAGAQRPLELQAVEALSSQKDSGMAESWLSECETRLREEGKETVTW